MWQGPIPAPVQQQQAFAAPPGWYVVAAQAEMDKQAEQHKQRITALEQQVEQQAKDAAALAAATPAAGNDGWGGMQPAWAGDSNQGGSSAAGKGDAGGIQIDKNKRHRTGKVCFSCYQTASYHGQGNCNNGTCPLNGGASPFVLLEALKNDMQAKLDIMSNKFDTMARDLHMHHHKIHKLHEQMGMAAAEPKSAGIPPALAPDGTN